MARRPSSPAAFVVATFSGLLLLVAGCVAAFDVLTPEKCGGDFKEVRVSSCPKLPCVFERGKSASVEVDFVPVESFDKLRASFRGEVSPNQWLPMPGFKRQACSKSGLQCPLEGGKLYTFSRTINVLPAFPALELTAEIRLEDANSTKIFCFYVPVKIV
ncbi:NPC intracellular cholesterol transporter 2-like [Amblyomma americanum]